jgi:hypothetical protein
MIQIPVSTEILRRSTGFKPIRLMDSGLICPKISIQSCVRTHHRLEVIR